MANSGQQCRFCSEEIELWKGRWYLSVGLGNGSSTCGLSPVIGGQHEPISGEASPTSNAEFAETGRLFKRSGASTGEQPPCRESWQSYNEAHSDSTHRCKLAGNHVEGHVCACGATRSQAISNAVRSVSGTELSRLVYETSVEIIQEILNSDPILYASREVRKVEAIINRMLTGMRVRGIEETLEQQEEAFGNAGAKAFKTGSTEESARPRRAAFEEIDSIANEIYMHGNYSERLRKAAATIRLSLTPEKVQGKQRCCDNGYFGEEHECQKSNPVAPNAPRQGWSRRLTNLSK